LALRVPEGAVVAVNSYHPEVRQRFSVAHELGHFLMDDSDQAHVVDFDAHAAGNPPALDPTLERRANSFAAALLMPARQLRSDARSMSLSRLARRYDVSQPAMGFRLTNLQLSAGGE
jgi:Zn-dependent peptidase ImmA (M78 family)